MVNFNLFKKKEQKGEHQLPTHPVLHRPPIGLAEKVRGLAGKGLPEPDIIKILRSEGFSPIDIDRAMRESLRSVVGEPIAPVKERPAVPLPRKEFERRPPLKKFDSDEVDMDHPAIPRLPDIPHPSSRREEDLAERGVVKRPLQFSGTSKDVQELIEVTVSEKWKELEEKLKETDERFKEIENRLKGVEDIAKQVRNVEDKKDREISEKIDTYKESIADLSSKMEGMESAMKDSLSPLMETMRSLSETIQALKKK